jgi:fatty acid desaturase
MGFGMAGIGLAIMHDANHGAYSNNKKVNDAVGFTLTFVGGYRLNWIIQHNVLHHSFTNVEGFDEDIHQKGVMRFSPKQGRKGFFKFQIIIYLLHGKCLLLQQIHAALSQYNKLDRIFELLLRRRPYRTRR